MAAAPLLMTVDEYFKTPETVMPSELVFGAKPADLGSREEMGKLRIRRCPTRRRSSIT